MNSNPDFDENQFVSSTRYIDTPNNFIKENFLYVQETGYLKSLKAHTSQRTNMNSFLIIYVISGEGFIAYQNIKRKVSKGACFYIDCSQPYAHESTEENPWELFWVHFNGPQARAYYNYFKRQNDNIFYLEDQNAIPSQISKIIETTESKKQHYELANNILINKLITIIIQIKKTSTDAQNNSLNDKLEQIHDYLQVNFRERITLDTLAKQFFISKYYLSRVFKQKYNISITAYITNQRITHSKTLLRFTDKSINQIAQESGIEDTTYFIKQFRKTENLTPTEYRKKW